ncbi:phytase [Altererythrobacter lutimaris]|uniref:Phytase n=1 Tax=Altererythrobacter lutimaris TaxID=2743979 RepID=A0A850H922_9SPHN|nr:phytase [Altererythrobacter lutimaris]NVE93451.1 phytase [Altererythrobacter lutimaris]
MRAIRGALALIAMGTVAACATVPVMGDPAVDVAALAETVPVGTTNEDAADDPAIWRNAANPAASLIVGTDKKAGLHVYALDGSQKSFLGAGLLNNVDLVELADGTILVAASDRTDPQTAHVMLAELDGSSGVLTEIGRYPVGPDEGYGLCMAQPDADGRVRVFSPVKDGSVVLTELRRGETGWQAQSRQLHKLATQPEGCVHDARTDMLYVGEENTGIWAFDLSASSEPELVAAIDNAQLVADVEGLALAPEGEDGGYLVASSQGDNAYAVFRLPDLQPVGRFRIAAGTFGATEETDGIALDNRSFGATYPDGLFVAQDGINGAAAQNFKYASWAEVKTALQLP